MNTGLDQYMDIFKDAVEDSAAKLTKSFEKDERYRRNSLYFDCLFQGTQV